MDSVHRQVYRRLRSSIVEGRLRPDERVPSARALAAQLGVARSTIDLAYALLSGEGYLVSRGARGTFVSPTLPVSVEPKCRPPAAPVQIAAPAEPVSAPLKLPFLVGLPAMDLFPRKVWSRLVARRSRSLGGSNFLYSSASGDHVLRKALASYLAVARGITCAPEDVIITGGYQAAFGIIARLILSEGDKVWIEDPGYLQTRQALNWAGAVAVPVTVDGEGIDIAAGLAQAPDAAMCVVTPSNQFPLGVALSLERRLALLDWANTHGSWVVEDDYDSEFYYEGRLLPALKSLDHQDRVFYVGTFSKTLFPGLRMGYVIPPKSQAKPFREACHLLGVGKSSFEQSIVADFLIEGYFARHLKKMRVAYRGRRAAMIAALKDELEPVLKVDPVPGGLNVIARLNDDFSDETLVCRAARAGYRPMALSGLGRAGQGRQGLLLGFTNVPENQALEHVRALRHAMELT